MGGKGGGSVAPYDTWINQIASYPNAKQPFESKRGKYGSEADWYAAYGGGQDNPDSNLISPEMSRDVFTKIYGTYKPPPAPAPAPVAAAAAAPPPPPPPAPVDTGPPAPLGPAIDPGGAIDQPGKAGNALGNELGGAVLNPPKYWVGGIDSYKAVDPASGRSAGALKVTE